MPGEEAVGPEAVGGVEDGEVAAVVGVFRVLAPEAPEAVGDDEEVGLPLGAAGAGDGVGGAGGVGEGGVGGRPGEAVGAGGGVVELAGGALFGDGVGVPEAEPAVAEPGDGAVVVVAEGLVGGIDDGGAFDAGLVEGVGAPGEVGGEERGEWKWRKKRGENAERSTLNVQRSSVG